MSVPSFSFTPLSHRSLVSTPRSNVTVRASPSRTERAIKLLLSILTALTPTPFNPTVFLNASEPYLPLVLILLTASDSELSGIPRP